MTLTTDPRRVGRGGRVRVSLTDAGKRRALVGREVTYHLADSAPVIVRITDVDTDAYPRGVIVSPMTLAGRTVRLGSVVTMADDAPTDDAPRTACDACGYTGGHWTYCMREAARDA